MSEAFDWSSPKTYSQPVDLDAYLEMPEEVSRAIEIKDGMVVFCESASPNHNAVSRNIERALLDANAKRSPAEPCLRVNRDLDMLVSEVPFHFKRPDVIVYRCIEHSRPRWKRKPTTGDTILAVEVVSPTTVTADLIDKRAEYARYGIQHYWIVRMANDDGPAISVEMLVLDSAGRYVSQGHRSRTDPNAPAIETLTPLDIRVTWQQLDEGTD
ncbi:Uma2 family endonuclease [Nocardia mexicana]|uniref:Uma2 family endonuclease n=1 Tax=Nocardia mexicana TaxID=279262 RepID=A0A370GUI6_9NOCA|nr:Uma2 family endonuclease [Nocardia mexicana]RDI47171.1 Uma2 family endonuclease [Nocardia mexicana]